MTYIKPQTPIPEHLVRRIDAATERPALPAPRPQSRREEIVIRKEAPVVRAAPKGLECPACGNQNLAENRDPMYPILCPRCTTVGTHHDFGGLDPEQEKLRRSGAFRPLPIKARDAVELPRDAEGKFLPVVEKLKAQAPQFRVRRRASAEPNVITVPGGAAPAPAVPPGLSLRSLPPSTISIVLRCPVCATLDVRQEMTAGVLYEHLVRVHKMPPVEAEQAVLQRLLKRADVNALKGRYVPR